MLTCSATVAVLMDFEVHSCCPYSHLPLNLGYGDGYVFASEA